MLWIRVALNPLMCTVFLTRDREEKMVAHGKTEAQTGLMSQAWDSLRAPKDGRDREGNFVRTFHGTADLVAL